ncbi:RNA polymerase sigma factor [Phycisphaerae bacterium RAS1]|nr:RNA polymerase sigma factor [Phycisphaerae bacterium RAS1]
MVHMFRSTDNPLTSDSPQVWDQLIDAVGPAALLVVIDSRMSTALRRSLTPEDVFQEALLHAWRDRAACEWRGVKSFRNWLLSIIDNRIRDLSEAASAAKRGNGRTPVGLADLRPPGQSTAGPLEPAGTTTPSRVAIYREQAAAIRAAVDSLPPELGEVLRLRLLEQLSVEETAERLQIGEAAVRHRFRKAAALYRERLAAEWRERSETLSRAASADAPGDALRDGPKSSP